MNAKFLRSTFLHLARMYWCQCGVWLF